MTDIAANAPAVGVARVNGVPLLHAGDVVRTVRAVSKRSGFVASVDCRFDCNFNYLFI